MALRIENTFTVPAGIDAAWGTLTDVPGLVPCMPGAELTGIVDERTYKGLGRIRVGPIELAFKGEARLLEADADHRRLRMSLRGTDAKGRGNVHAEMAMSLAIDGEATRVDVTTDLVLSGAVAQYGRGAGIVREICNQFTAKFAANLAARMGTGGTACAEGEPAQPLSAIGLVAGAVKAAVTRRIAAGSERSGTSEDGAGPAGAPPADAPEKGAP